MEKSHLIDLINDELSIAAIAEKTNFSKTNVRYWLKKHNLKTKNNKYNRKYKKSYANVLKYCPICEKKKELDEFYPRSADDRKHEPCGYCKTCSNAYHTKRVRRVKIRMIGYKGGECVDCKKTLFDFHPDLFDFHHRDSTQKDINFNRIKYQKWDYIKKELDKCNLMCSNCHRTLEAEIREGKKYEYNSRFANHI